MEADRLSQYNERARKNFGKDLFPAYAWHAEFYQKMMNYSMHYCMMAPRLQLIFASAVLSACGTLAEQGFRRAAQGNIMPGYRGFYNDLSAVNERAFVRIVHTKEYASLMQETMRFLSEIKRSGDGNGSGPGASGNPLRKI